MTVDDCLGEHPTLKVKATVATDTNHTQGVAGGRGKELQTTTSPCTLSTARACVILRRPFSQPP